MPTSTVSTSSVSSASLDGQRLFFFNFRGIKHVPSAEHQSPQSNMEIKLNKFNAVKERKSPTEDPNLEGVSQSPGSHF